MGNYKNNDKKGKLLIVEDNNETLSVLELIFKNHYNIEKATSGIEALRMIKSGYKPHVILSDQLMPNMSGSEFLEATIPYVPEAPMPEVIRVK